MKYNKIAMGRRKKVALVAHDNTKFDLLEWAGHNRDLLSEHEVFATGMTGGMLERELSIEVTKLQSGALGGDQQIGARITEGVIDFLIFFWDPLQAHSHDPDVKALLRMAVLWNIPVACDRTSADFMITSPLMDQEYERLLPQHANVWRTPEAPSPLEG
ncbi:MAG TPA: methylglyoxal synthase [Rubrobacteraceae bacterium]|nr:methylglyoxal synthase [Rubrobacteraceae bacterium]